MCAWILKQLQSTCLFTSYPHNSPLVAPDVGLGKLLFWIHTALLRAQLSKISTITFTFLASVFITLVFTLSYSEGMHNGYCSIMIFCIGIGQYSIYISQFIGYKLDRNWLHLPLSNTHLKLISLKTLIIKFSNIFTCNPKCSA